MYDWLIKFAGVMTCTGLFVAPSANASTVGYMLDQSNALPDGIEYVMVVLSDDIAGQLDVWVETQTSLSGIAGDNYGIQSFGFNLADGSAVLPLSDDFILPDGWNVKTHKNMSEAGMFDFRLQGTGQSRQDPLHFSVLGLATEDIANDFASHIAGFAYSNRINSAFFYGKDLMPLPLPATSWLFASGLIALASIVRRSQKISVTPRELNP